ncbi:MAG: hypothetical protein KJZ87_24575 [Thermoguttaceae bacterium]|nr:hypothetical protein [Thermoguttaceae bacterium]
MGSRASYVVQRNGQMRAYGSHWGASSMIDDLLWGPEHATKVFEAQAAIDDVQDIYGGDEGAALIDWDGRRLVWFMSNCELPVQQRLYNRLMEETWPGWKIEHADRRHDDLMTALGLKPVGAPDGTHDEQRLPEDERADEEAEAEEQDAPPAELEDATLREPRPIPEVVADIQDLEPGNWITVRDSEGTCRDYFGFGNLYGTLKLGESLVEQLAPLASLRQPPPELLTLDGVFIDQPARTLWRWEGTRYGWQERPLERKWQGWTFKDLHGGWAEQVRATGRQPDGLAGGERQILGTTISGLLTDSSRDPMQMLSKAAGVARGTRVGCAVVTVALAAIGIALARWLDSTVLLVMACMLGLVCAAITALIWKATSVGLGMVKSVSTGHQDAPRPRGFTIAEKHEVLNRCLARLHYPSIEQLQAGGEMESDDR